MANTYNSPVINPVSTLLTDPVRNFKFLVSFNPTDGAKDTLWGSKFGQMGFVSLSGLSITTEPIAYREGGYNTNVHQIPGQSAFTPISLSKGVMIGQPDNALWMKRLFSVLTPSATTGVGASFRCDLDIQVLSHPNPKAYGGTGDTSEATTANDQHTSMRFKVYNAWISSLSYSNLDAGSNTLMVEEMTLVHEGWDVHYATDLSVNGSAKNFDA
jgi:phage tail-like protein